MLMNRLKTTIRDIPSWGANLFLFSAPLGVCSIYFEKFEYLVLPLSLVLLFVFRNSSKFFLPPVFYKVSLCFYLPMAISAVWAIAVSLWEPDLLYTEYLTGDFITRMIHLSFYFFIFLGIMALHWSPAQYVKVLNTYAWGVLLILGIMGLWQVMHQITGIWCPELETRSEMYFAMEAGVSRITSFADEPSYLAPFLIDAILIFLFVKRYVFAVLLLVLLLFSMSFGGYMELAILLLSCFFLCKMRVKLRMVAGLACVCIVAVMVFPDVTDFVKLMLESRAELQTGYKLEDTSRTLFYVQLIREWLGQDVVSMFVGSGPSSLKYLYASNSQMLFLTANNIYLDMLYETGIIGLICYCVLILYFWRKISRAGIATENIIPKLFIIHILLSSFYRSDYASARYVCLFVILYCFYNILNNTKENLYASNYQRRRLRIFGIGEPQDRGGNSGATDHQHDGDGQHG